MSPGKVGKEIEDQYGNNEDKNHSGKYSPPVVEYFPQMPHYFLTYSFSKSYRHIIF